MAQFQTLRRNIMKWYKNSANLRAGFTEKDMDQLENNNTALHVAKNAKDVLNNRQTLADELTIPLAHFVCANQTHSANVVKVTSALKGRGAFSAEDAIADTDALYTREKNIVLCTFTADCVPIVFYDPTLSLIGVIHSGWQGTVKEIARHTFQTIIKDEGCNPQNLHIHIGAALSQEKFEVDEDVYHKFKTLGYADEWMYFNPATKKYHIDNQQVVKKQCELTGIPSENISVDATCTFKSDSGFSYREDRTCGRHLHFIVQH